MHFGIPIPSTFLGFWDISLQLSLSDAREVINRREYVDKCVRELDELHLQLQGVDGPAWLNLQVCPCIMTMYVRVSADTY